MRNMLSIRSLLFTLGMLLMTACSYAQVRVGVSITIAPPELPVYEQPICPGDGYIWTPGYWAYGDDDGYYWVPGTWVEAPEVGFLWTPGYWGWRDGGYFFNEGYWGPQVGFYGGINYGFGYFGHGFEGGRWDGGHFFYNRAVANVNVTVIHNVYNTRVNETNVTRVSFNGGSGGINARADAREEAAARERHVAPVAAQRQHFEAARGNPELRASANHGKPPIAATAKPGELRGGGAVAAKEGGAVHEAPGARPENNNAARPNNVVHPNDIARGERPAAPNTGNANKDKKFQQQQDKLQAQQDKERQNLQRKQDQEHQKLEQRKPNDTTKQQVEQKHQQQTQQLAQKHVQQQQHLQQRQLPAARPAAPRAQKP